MKKIYLILLLSSSLFAQPNPSQQQSGTIILEPTEQPTYTEHPTYPEPQYNNGKASKNRNHYKDPTIDDHRYDSLENNNQYGANFETPRAPIQDSDEEREDMMED